MLLSDLHFHPCLSANRAAARRRALDILLLYAGLGIRLLAVTEHNFRRPHASAALMREVWEGMNRRDYPAPVLIPGVEANTRENVDLIYLFRDLESLRRSRALHHRGFSWHDALSIREDEGALLVIPHPFGPGRTSLGRTAGHARYLDIASRADYVETHNGSAVAILQVARGLRSNRVGRQVGRLLPTTQWMLEATDRLPRWLVPEEAGTCVGTDIHFPGIPQSAGSVDHAPPESEGEAFDLLARRLRFREFRLFDDLLEVRLNQVFRTSVHALYESLRKQIASRRRPAGAPRVSGAGTWSA